jgi:TRAP transporter TAXI family solute receptor
MAGRILEAYGIDPVKDIRRERLSVNEAVNAIKDRKIDAFLHAAGIPLPAVTDLSATPGITAKLIDHADVVEAMNKKYGPIYAQAKVPAKTYRGQERDNAVATVWGVLYVNASMSEKTAYELTKTLFEHRDELIRAHRESANMTLENQMIGASPAPYHPGALKYFREKGITPR